MKTKNKPKEKIPCGICNEPYLGHPNPKICVCKCHNPAPEKPKCDCICHLPKNTNIERTTLRDGCEHCEKPKEKIFYPFPPADKNGCNCSSGIDYRIPCPVHSPKDKPIKETISSGCLECGNPNKELHYDNCSKVEPIKVEGEKPDKTKPWNNETPIVIDGHFDNPERAWKNTAPKPLGDKRGWKKHKFTLTWFKRFFMDTIDLDCNPPVRIPPIKNAKKCWKYFVEPMIAHTKKKTLDEVEAGLGRYYTEEPKGKFQIIMTLEDLQNLLDKIKKLEEEK